MEQDQSFFLFCCPEEYSISFPNHSLSANSNYFVNYTYPDGTIKKAAAELGGAGVLFSQSPEYGQPCKVVASLHASSEEVTEDITDFSIDLVSPVEYLFRKFSSNEFEMSDKMSDKMASALLAMALAYYHIMEEHVEKDKRTDEIFVTLLNCSKDEIHKNSESQKGDISEDSITKFAQQYKLCNTLQYLSGGVSVGDLAVQSPKPLCPPSDGDVSVKDVTVTSQPISDSQPTSDMYNVPNNKPLSGSQPEELDQVDYEINDIPPRPPKPNDQSPSDATQVPMKKPTINPPIRSDSQSTINTAYDVPNNKPLSGSQSEELDQVDYEINDIPPRPPKPNDQSPSDATQVPMKKPTINPLIRSDSQSTINTAYDVPNNKPLPGAPAEELDQVDYEITDPPPRPPKPDAVSACNGKVAVQKSAVDSQVKSDSQPTSNNVYNVPNNKPLSGHPPIELDQEEYVITDPPPRPPKSDVLSPNGKATQAKSDSSGNAYNVPNNKPLPGSPTIATDQEGYVETDPPPKNGLDDSNDVEEYVLTDQTDSSQVRYVEGPSKSTKSLSSIQASGQSPTAFKPPASLPRVRSATGSGQLIISEEYEMWEATPAEMAAEKAMKNRGPQPKLPAPYQKSRSLDRSAKHSVSSSGRESTSSEADSSPASPLQNVSSPVVLKPPPRRKFSIHKPRVNKQPT